MPKAYSEEIIEKAYDLIVNKKYSASKACKELKVDRGTMCKRLKEKYGDIFLPDGKKRVDSNYFNEINSEDKAYWLGFLTADGYVKNNIIELALAEKDKEHIEKFKNAIKSEHTIGKKKTILNDKEFLSYRITLRDNKMGEDLASYGLDNNKSYNAFIPSIFKLPYQFVRHYMRGLFDGDGSIYNGANGINISIVSGSKEMAKDIYYTVKQHTGLKMFYRKSRDLHELRLFSQKDVNKFLSWLYDESSIYLDRKYNKFKNADLGQKPLKS